MSKKRFIDLIVLALCSAPAQRLSRHSPPHGVVLSFYLFLLLIDNFFFERFSFFDMYVMNRIFVFFWLRFVDSFFIIITLRNLIPPWIPLLFYCNLLEFFFLITTVCSRSVRRTCNFTPINIVNRSDKCPVKFQTCIPYLRIPSSSAFPHAFISPILKAPKRALTSHTPQVLVLSCCYPE